MTTPNVQFLQSRSLTAGQATNFDAPSHPAKGLLVGYLLRITGTANAASNVTPTYAEWRDTILDTLFSNIQLFAPRFNNQLCSGNLTGRYWAELFEAKYKACMPIEYDNTPVDGYTTQQLTNANKEVQFDFFVPFEEPSLAADRHWSCPPAHLFRGDVSLSVTLPSSLVVTVQTVAITFSSFSARWEAVTVHGDIARVPVVHRFEVRTVNSDSVDVGRGFPVHILDRRAPGTTVGYDIIVDGENVNNGQLLGEDFKAMQRIAGSPQLIKEDSVSTPLRFVAQDANLNELEYVERSLSLKLYGASSATLALHFLEAPSDTLKRNVQAALGQEGVASDAPPVAPNGVALGNLHRKVALNGPRTLMLKTGAGYTAPKGAAVTLPTFPAGSTGAQIAGSMMKGA